ncbi:uncharacterized protein ARMOST_01812 [Armillaria ostoyae]|uniref:Fido domain-containing protein n=1 Tax=Armillaria ostoyae TaxID=47428 RepID=A0A284QQ08_ARMOS|nr:uncharacterized protein ARMOST_01812 [Armillaria ostoyae]
MSVQTLGFAPNFALGIPVTEYPPDLNKVWTRSDFLNTDTAVATAVYRRFYLHYRQLSGPALEQRTMLPGCTQGEDSRLTVIFSGATKIYAENIQSDMPDPRIAMQFSQLLFLMASPAAALEVATELEKRMRVPCPYLQEYIQSLQNNISDTLRQTQLDIQDGQSKGAIHFVYAPGCIEGIPQQHPPLRFLFPSTKERAVSDAEAERLLRSISVNTNLIEGVFSLPVNVTRKLIIDGSLQLPRPFDLTFVASILKDSREAIGLTLDHRQEEFSVDLVQEVHKMFTRNACITSSHTKHALVETHHFPPGRFKHAYNTVRTRDGKIHVFCPPQDVESELVELFRQLNEYLPQVRPDTEDVFWLSAWFHHRFVNIHPFQDGNGRVTRALVSAILGRFGFLPFHVSAEDKEAYLDALTQADDGNLHPLANFFVRQQLLAHLTAKYDPAAERGPLTQFRQNILHWVDNELPEALSRLAGTYHRVVQKVPDVPEIQLMLHDPRRLEISQSPSGSQMYFLEYGSLWPLTTDIFTALLTERGNGGVTKICAVTAIWFSEG